jgi:nitrous oxide reductase
MSTSKPSEETNHNRRGFVSTAAVMIAAAQFGVFGSANAQSTKANPANGPRIKGGGQTPRLSH